MSSAFVGLPAGRAGNGVDSSPRSTALMLLALAFVLLVAFGAIVGRIAERADTARGAEETARRDRVDCERRPLAVARRDCRLSVELGLRSR